MKQLALILLALLLARPSGVEAATPPRVAVVELEDTIQPASLRYLERALEEAADQGAALVIIELNTPGGTLVSLRAMTTAIVASAVPVAVLVAPSGAQAASAGFFLVLAADVAAMAPGTNTGAAHPVSPGADPSGEKSVALEKATEDVAALARSLAAARGRPVDRAEDAVRESRSYSAEEAREHGLVDLVVRDRAGLLDELEGRSVQRFDGSRAVLEVRGAEVSTVEPTLAERVLGVIAHPNVAYLLLMLGLLGILVELTSPGAVVPGVLGAISLLLGLYAFAVLPVNWVGALLIAMGLGLLAAEVFVTSYGLLAAGGVASLVLGSLMLFDPVLPGFGVGLEVVSPVALVMAAAILLLAARGMRVRRLAIRAGPEAMVGEEGELVRGIPARRGEGKVFVHGEYWEATADAPVPDGAKVRVERVDGRRLWVAPLGPLAT